MDDDEPAEIVICQGPPACQLEGAEAAETMKAGCIWCKRMLLLPTGEWQTTEPARA